MPGFSFAGPGPADGVGSLASRQVDCRLRRSAGRALSRGLCVVAGVKVSCHRYYDQLRLPIVHPTRLRTPARSVVPAFSAFIKKRSTLRWRPFRRELWYRGGLPGRIAPLMIRAFDSQETMRLSRVPVSSLDRHALVYDPGGLLGNLPLALPRMLRSSTLKLSAVRTARTQASVWRLSLCPPVDERFGPRHKPRFGARYRACRLAPPGFRPLSPPADGLRYRVGG